jgi:hypothetical protein
MVGNETLHADTDGPHYSSFFFDGADLSIDSASQFVNPKPEAVTLRRDANALV